MHSFGDHVVRILLTAHKGDRQASGYLVRLAAKFSPLPPDPQTVVTTDASIGSGAPLLANITIGGHARIGGGSVVPRDVPANAIVAEHPEPLLRSIAHEASAVQ